MFSTWKKKRIENKNENENEVFYYTSTFFLKKISIFEEDNLNNFSLCFFLLLHSLHHSPLPTKQVVKYTRSMEQSMLSESLNINTKSKNIYHLQNNKK